MYNKIVIVSRTLKNSKSFISSLEELASEVITYDSLSTEMEVTLALKNADAIVTGLAPLSKNVLSSAKSLKVISNYGVGLDNIDLKVAQDLGIKIGWQPGINKTSVCEIVISRIIDLNRGLTLSHNSLLKEKWLNAKGKELRELKIGILGLGEIGKTVALALKFFGAEIHSYDLYPDNVFIKTHNIINHTNINDFAGSIDGVTCHVPLTDETRNIVDYNFLKTMPKGAFIINTSRGGIVNESDLIRTLDEKHISGCSLDVFEIEPFQNKKFLAYDNFLGSAHIAGTSNFATSMLSQACIDGLKNPLSVQEIIKRNPWLSLA